MQEWRRLEKIWRQEQKKIDKYQVTNEIWSRESSYLRQDVTQSLLRHDEEPSPFPSLQEIWPVVPPFTAPVSDQQMLLQGLQRVSSSENQSTELANLLQILRKRNPSMQDQSFVAVAFSTSIASATPVINIDSPAHMNKILRAIETRRHEPSVATTLSTTSP